MEPPKFVNSHSNLEEKEQMRRHHSTWFQNITQHDSNQNTWKEIHRPVEHTTEPRNKYMVNWHWQRCQEHTMKKGQFFNKELSGVGKAGFPRKEWNCSLFYPISLHIQKSTQNVINT